MSDKIKPSEVSQILLEQLKGINNSQQFDEVGTVLEVSTVCVMQKLTNSWSSKMAQWLS